MRAALIHNPKSGTAGTEHELVDQLEAIGWTVVHCPKKEDLDGILHSVDVVVVAGGDGTISRVAKRLAGTQVPIAIVPMGTANNMARSLGLGVEASTAVDALNRASERRIDLGLVVNHHRKEYFVEGFGVGLFAYVMGERASNNDKTMRKALTLIADELEGYEPGHVELEVDGSDHSGDFVLAALMNAKSFGPALALAPEARLDDGELDLVLVRPEGKPALVAHLRRAAQEGDIALPAFETLRARHVRARADSRWVHIDDTARQLEGEILIEAIPGAVTVLVPPRSPAERVLERGRGS